MQELADQFLIRGAHNDLSVLIAASHSLSVNHIIHFTGTSDKIIVCHNMLTNFQEISVYLNICT